MNGNLSLTINRQQEKTGRKMAEIKTKAQKTELDEVNLKTKKID